MANEKTESESKEKNKTTEGIIYISKIPPFMKPIKLKGYMAQFGEVGRLFLQPEDSLIRKRRKNMGGSGRKMFTEGWVEFKDKRVAKAVARTLNGQIISGKKRSYYHDDMWNIKYLRKFKWGHISEKLAYEKAAREQRMRTEISQVKKEANFYIENMEKRKRIDAIEERKRKKGKLADNSLQTDLDAENTKLAMQKYRQRRVVEKSSSKSGDIENQSRKQINASLLSKVF